MKMKRWTLEIIMAIIIASIVFLCSKIISEMYYYEDDNNIKRTTTSQKENTNSNNVYKDMANMYLAQNNLDMWNLYMSLYNSNR